MADDCSGLPGRVRPGRICHLRSLRRMLARGVPLIEPHQIGEQFEYQAHSSRRDRLSVQRPTIQHHGDYSRFWKVLELKRNGDELLIRVETWVGALKYTALSRYAFTLDKAGNRVLQVLDRKLGSNSWAIFSSPNEGEEGVFVASAIR